MNYALWTLIIFATESENRIFCHTQKCFILQRSRKQNLITEMLHFDLCEDVDHKEYWGSPKSIAAKGCIQTFQKARPSSLKDGPFDRAMFTD